VITLNKARSFNDETGFCDDLSLENGNVGGERKGHCQAISSFKIQVQ
jgi:hypothetical protein